MKDYLIHSPLEHFARERPEHPALRMQGENLTYKDLDQASNQLAHALIDNGACVQDRVGIFMHKSFEMATAIYAILKCGCVFVPLDPFMPAQRLALIIEDCGIKHLVTSDQLASITASLPTSTELTLYGVAVQSPFRQLTWDDVKQCTSSSPDVSIIDKDLGYIMYTSGSTGIPKGMMHTHVGSIAYARWGARHVGMHADDRVASHAPLHFDLSIFDFFSTAQSGATVVLVPEGVTRFPTSWARTIEADRISIVFTVPYTLTSMMERGAINERDLSSLRWILYGGEPYPPRQLKMLMDALPGVTVSNIYGPAEAPSCTRHIVREVDIASDEPIPIGTVSSNSDDLIIDDNTDDCGIGEPGELCIRSTTLMRGYWNRPDLNASCFLLRDAAGQSPFPTVYFRTGDRVVRHADGLLRFLGRMDRMVKIRGHRVELDEIESILGSHANVAEVGVITVADDAGIKSIRAVVSGEAQKPLDEAELLKLCRSRLPPYAVPETIAIMDRLPHNSNGKVDRLALVRAFAEKHER